MPELAYLNGTIMPVENALISIEDRGYQFGDAVYEFVVSYGGKLFRMEDHLKRLARSMRELSFPDISMSIIEQAIVDLFEASQLSRAGIYIQVSRGVAPREHSYSNQMPLQTVMTVKPFPEIHPQIEHGTSAITVEDFRWGRCDIKTVQLLPNTLSKQKAVDSGAGDAIFVSQDGVVREATSTNVFIIKDNKAVTHPLNNNILPGITRQVILEICREKNIPYEERFFKTDALYSADEVFLTGTLTEVLPIISINEKTIADGKPGPLAKALFKEIRMLAYK